MAWKKTPQQGWTKIENEGGAVLGVADCPILEQDGFAFKDLARTGTLLPYEDWRLPARQRAEDLAARLSMEEIAGLMLYSSHQCVPFAKGLPFSAHYDGTTFEESGLPADAMTDEQKTLLAEDNIRHVLLMRIQSPEVAARWNNRLQAAAEALPFGIPVNLSSDPRHGAAESGGVEFRGEAQGESKWPEGLAMASTFDPELCRSAARIMAEEYRDLGIATALGPQVDLGTDPRWFRWRDTFGPHTGLAVDMARAYCDGMQTTPEAPGGWGGGSVNAMAKHWPGGGTGEGGRDAHYAFGQYAVYPGGKFEEHLKPFLNGAFALEGGTKQAAAVMPYYTVSWGVDTKNGQNVGNSYSEYIIKDLLREKYGYEGVICTDWGITAAPNPAIEGFGSRCYGRLDETEAEHHLQIILNGVDQFGGNNAKAPVLEAYRLGCEKVGEPAMTARMRRSAVRLLTNFFRTGLFENPYRDPAATAAQVGSPAHMAAGYAAQLKSPVLLKNKNAVLPLQTGIKVYVPNRHVDAKRGFFRQPMPAEEITPCPPQLLGQYFTVVDSPAEADAALVFMDSPDSECYDPADLQNGGNGYYPISLQYRPYTAAAARAVSIAGGDPRDPGPNRSYRGKTSVAYNHADLDNLAAARAAMGDKPVIAIVSMSKGAVLAEAEPLADAVLADFGVQRKALLDLVAGAAEPQGLLPVQLPADMETLERHCEDDGFDYTPYTDTMGNTYGFGFGLNWGGVIADARTEKYCK